MRNQELVLFSLLLLTITFLSSCRKDTQSIDYRSKYTGEYNLTVSYNSWNIDTGGGSYSYETQGSIRECLTSDETTNWGRVTDSNLVLTYSNQTLFLEIDTQGDLWDWGFNCRFVGFDSLAYAYPDGNNSIGQGTNYTIHGKKID